MAVIATVTISGVNHSVYGITADAVTDATGYLGGSLRGAAWTAATSDGKKQALVEAARMLDRAVEWSGTKTVATQPREWPRDGATCDGTAIANGTIPDDIAYAEFELALLLLIDSSVATGSGTGSNVQSVKAGSAQVSFFTPTVGGANDTRLPQVVHDLVKCLYGGTNGVGTPFAGGTDEESDFGPCDFESMDGWS